MDQKVGFESKSAIGLSVIIPVFNEEQSIQGVIRGIQDTLSGEEIGYEIIVVDDGSQDATARVAEEAGADVLTHAYNIGNGAAVKTGIRAARGKHLVMMDGDGQHDPQDIPRLVDGLSTYDMVVGSRTSRSDTALHRDVANSIYNLLASYICGRRILDLTSGFRAVKTAVALEFLSLLPNTFSYPTTLTLAVARSGYQFSYIPIEVTRRVGKSKINLVNDGFRFLLILFKISTLFSPLKVFIPTAAGLFLLGFTYGLFKVLVLGTRYGPTSAMLMTISGVVFLIGLVSEQISQLRFQQFSKLDPPDYSD